MRCLLVTEPDALIGALAVQYGERLATFNRRQYPGISRLIPWH